MRVLIVCLMLALVCTGASFAAEATLPAQPPPTNEPPTITAPVPSEQVKPLPNAPGPLLEIPSPVQPSEPIGPFAHRQRGSPLGGERDLFLGGLHQDHPTRTASRC